MVFVFLQAIAGAMIAQIRVLGCYFNRVLFLGCLFCGATTVLADVLLADNGQFKLIQLDRAKNAAALSVEYLDDRYDAGQIGELNGRTVFSKGDVVAIPRVPINPFGVDAQSTRLMPILCYHQFAPGTSAARQLQVSAADFERQMAYLHTEGYQVIPLKKLLSILKGKSAVPPKTVVLTIDDGYRSVYEVAYPILKKYGFSATLFVYTDFVGGAAALSWSQIKLMSESGVIDVESHTKSHSSLSFDIESENLAAHQTRIAMEIDMAAKAIKRHIGQTPTILAYPYGKSSPHVSKYLQQADYQMALTVKRGANPAYADPYLLQRTMIYNHHSLADFKKFLSTSTSNSRW